MPRTGKEKEKLPATRDTGTAASNSTAQLSLRSHTKDCMFGHGTVEPSPRPAPAVSEIQARNWRSTHQTIEPQARPLLGTVSLQPLQRAADGAIDSNGHRYVKALTCEIL